MEGRHKGHGRLWQGLFGLTHRADSHPSAVRVATGSHWPVAITAHGGPIAAPLWSPNLAGRAFQDCSNRGASGAEQRTRVLNFILHTAQLRACRTTTLSSQCAPGHTRSHHQAEDSTIAIVAATAKGRLQAYKVPSQPPSAFPHRKTHISTFPFPPPALFLPWSPHRQPTPAQRQH